LQSSDGRSNPGRLRVTDVNKDGFPDIVVTASFINDQTAFSLTQVLVNQPKLESANPTRNEIKNAKREFKPLEKESPMQKVIQ